MLFKTSFLGLCWVSVAAQAFLWLSQAGATLQLWCTGFSLRGLLLLWSIGSVVVARELSCSEAGEIFPDQGSNLHLLPWQAYSLPLSHQGSPKILSILNSICQSTSQVSSTQQSYVASVDCPGQCRYRPRGCREQSRRSPIAVGLRADRGARLRACDKLV